jgi:hypothetical protein
MQDFLVFFHPHHPKSSRAGKMKEQKNEQKAYPRNKSSTPPQNNSPPPYIIHTNKLKHNGDGLWD